MMILITYDVNTMDKKGRTRLRKVAKICQNYGQRVQNSVFECVADAGQLLKIKEQLRRTIDPESDSLRFYVLGNNYKGKIEHVGVKPSLFVEDAIIV